MQAQLAREVRGLALGDTLRATYGLELSGLVVLASGVQR